MSIDLSTVMSGPISLKQILPDIASVLREMLGLDSVAPLLLEVLDAGERGPAVTDELRDRSSPFFLLSIKGEPETVGFMADGECVTVTMAAQRTSLEYALGAAAVIAIARKFGGRIEDPWRFFGDQSERSSEDLLRSLRRRLPPNVRNDIRGAAHQVFVDKDVD